ncbi:CATRA conflict system CASPASE/TPR repeat-associated protein [Streptomyces sp. NPDC006553]|uniref:CATRA conflict system CASPASE/TPR repeat-associated protein n=1 Tax=Streptomyces sp. NPDC006553 TaxID=3157180 RepID=UPI0033A51D9D
MSSGTGSEPRHAREALQLHYLFASQRFDAEGAPLLRLLWESCAQADMGVAVQPGGELTLPDRDVLTAGVGFRSLRQRSDADGSRQAMLYRLNDVVGLTVMLAADEGPGRSAAESARVLRALERTWDEARARARATQTDPGTGAGPGSGSDSDTDTDTNTEADPSLIGSARIHRSLRVPDGSGGSGGSATTDLAAVGEELRQELAPQARLSRPVETDDGLMLWEITRSDDGFSAPRDLLVTTSATDEQEGLLDDWSWYAAHGDLVPLTRYLIGAAQIRENHRVRLESSAAMDDHLARLRRDGEELTRQWQDLTARSEAGSAVGRRTLAHWERLSEQARRALAEERLASATTLGLRTMARSLEIASAALRVLGTGADGRPRVLDTDEDHRARLAAVLDDDVTYFAVAREHVAEAARVASESAAQRLQGHQQYLSLIQTTVIGALLLTLTAVQALAYKPPVPVRLHAPLIAFFGSLGLVLPLLVVRRWRGGTGGRIGGVLEIGSLAAAGGAAGWLAGRSLGHTAPGVLAGAALLAVLGILLTRRSSP